MVQNAEPVGGVCRPTHPGGTMHTIRRLVLGFALAATLAPTVSLAGSPKEDRAKEEVKMSKAVVKDQKKDLKSIKKLAKKWNKAAEKGKTSKMLKVDEKMSEWMKEELKENRQQTQQAKKEFEQSGGDRAALAGAAGGNQPPPPKPQGKVKPQPKPEKPAVPKKAQDDFQDAKKAIVAQKNMKEMADEFSAMQPKFSNGNAGPKLIKRKSKLLADLVVAAERDLNRAEKELEEDQARLAKLK